MPAPRIPVSLKEGCAWEEGLHSAVVGRLLLQLATHDHRTIARVVANALKLPNRKERAKMAPSKGADAERQAMLHQHRLINKAMSMELLCASLLSHLDSAVKVESLCEAVCRRPYYFARPGAPDLVATYAEHPSAEGFRVLGEVSAKRQVDQVYWLSQLDQAVRHALTLHEQEPDTPVYALVVNGGRIGEEVTLQKAYREFIRKDKRLKLNKGVRVVPIAGADLAYALLRLDGELPGERFWFGSGRLAQAFDAMIEMLLNPPASLSKGWMAQVLINAGTSAAQLVPRGGDSGFRP